jgi:cobalt/nickel transport system permease protein
LCQGTTRLGLWAGIDNSYAHRRRCSLCSGLDRRISARGCRRLGVNTLNLALPAVVIGLVAHRFLVRSNISPRSLTVVVAGFLVGALSFGVSAVSVAGVLALSGSEFLVAAKLTLIVQTPVMLVEGAITAATLRLLVAVRPELIPVAAHDQLLPAERTTM